MIFGSSRWQNCAVPVVKTACVLAANQVVALTAALKLRPTADEWNEKLALPAAELVKTMDILTDSAGKRSWEAL